MKLTVKVRTCNCSDLVMQPGIMRLLMEALGRQVDNQPCSHWEWYTTDQDTWKLVGNPGEQA